MPKKHAHPLDRVHMRSTVALATLAAQTGLLLGARTLTQDYVLKKVKGLIGVEAQAADDPATIVGMASADLSLAEIEQYMENGLLRVGDVVVAEMKERPIQILAAVGHGLETIWIEERIFLPTFQEDIGFVFFAYNPASNARATASDLVIALDGFGRWL